MARTSEHAGPASDAPDAQTLAAHLYRHAETVRARHAALDDAIAAEDAAASTARGTSGALRAEIAQFHGWVSGEHQGGGAYRLSRQLHEERDRRLLLESEVGLLRDRLGAIGKHVATLSHVNSGPTPASTLAAHTTDALLGLGRLEDLGRPRGPM